MITFFPTPYPDEWWYSVLCRYYVRSGIKEHQIAKKMLFGGKVEPHMGTIFPNKSVAQVVKQLPQSEFSIEEIFLHHTTFPYYTRMYPINEKNQMLSQLCNEETVQLTHLWKNFKRADWKPRCCLQCITEDREKYGEAYWHVQHQIPLVTVCQKHQCRLESLDIEQPYPALNQTFYPLNFAMTAPNTIEPKPWELGVSKIAEEYWRLPISVGPNREYNNIMQELQNRGFQKIYQQGSVAVHPQMLQNALESFYGTAIVKQYFGTIDAGIVKRLRCWDQLLPERYALIQNMLEMTTETAFGDKTSDALETRLQALARTNSFRTETEAADLLGVQTSELRTILKCYHMDQFWVSQTKKKYPAARKGLIRCRVDEQELASLVNYSQKKGYSCVGNFVMDCVRYVIAEERKNRP